VVLLLSRCRLGGLIQARSGFCAHGEANRASSTFFIQTKYVDDADSKAFFSIPISHFFGNEGAGSQYRSHSIIHSRGFNKFDLGTGQETYSTYQPRGLGFDTASGATVFGEVRVSKELLDGEIPGQQTIFSVPDICEFAFAGEALVRSGYEFDPPLPRMTYSATSDMPYLDLGFEEDSGIYEFRLRSRTRASRLCAARAAGLEVIRAMPRMVQSGVLVHSNESKTKSRCGRRNASATPSRHRQDGHAEFC